MELINWAADNMYPERKKTPKDLDPSGEVDPGRKKKEKMAAAVYPERKKKLGAKALMYLEQTRAERYERMKMEGEAGAHADPEKKKIDENAKHEVGTKYQIVLV